MGLREDALDKEQGGYKNALIRGLGYSGTRTLSLLNAMGLDVADPKKLDNLQQKLEDIKEYQADKGRSDERKEEVKKLHEEASNAKGAYDVSKATLKNLLDTATHPSDWTAQGVVETLSDPTNAAGFGLGGKLASTATTIGGKIAKGAAGGAIEGAAVNAAAEAANAYGLDKSEEDIKKAAIAGASGGAVMGAGVGGVAGSLTKTKSAVPKDEPTPKDSNAKLFEEEEIHPDAIINVVKSAKKKEEPKPVVTTEAKPAEAKEIVSDIANARAEAVGKNKDELLSEHPLEVREHKSVQDVVLKGEAKVGEKVDSDQGVGVNKDYETKEISPDIFFQAFDDATEKIDNAHKEGSFGTIFTRYKHDYKSARDVLLEAKSGDAIGALQHKELGDIDLVYGIEGTAKSDGMGLAKIAKYHPEVLDNLQDIIYDMPIVSRSKNRINLESDIHKASVRLDYDGVTKHWLLTAFEKRDRTVNRSTDLIDTSINADGKTTPSSNDKTIPQPQQKTQGAIKGMFEKVGNGGVIHIFENSDMTTVFHESAHWLESTFSQVEKDAFDMAFGKFEEGRSRSEAFAEGFVKWSATGEAPNATIKGVFEKTREFLRDVLSTLLNSKEAKFKLSPSQELFYRGVFGDEEAKAYLSKALQKREDKKPKASANEVLYQRDDALKKGFNTPTLMPAYNFLSDFLRAQGKVGAATKAALVKVHGDKLYEAMSRHTVYGGNRADAVIDAFSAYKIEQSARGNKSTDVYKHLEKLSKEERAELHLVLSGDKEISTLKPSLFNTYKALRNIIDQNAKELIELDELKIGDDIEHYLARTYQKDLKEANSIWNSITSSGGSVDHIKVRRGKAATMWMDGSRAKEYEIGDSLTTKDGHTFEIESMSYGGDGKAKLTLHRDYTFAERGEMGEIRDAAFSVWYTLQKQNAQIIRAKLLQNIPTKAFDDEETAKAAGFFKVPDEATAERFKLYGSLGGKYIGAADKADLDYYLNISSSSGLAAQAFGAWNAWTKVVTLVKLNDTVKNVSTHLNNFMSNTFVMSLRDPLAFATLGNPKKLMDAYKRIHELGLSDGEMPDIENFMLKEFGDDAAKNTNILFDMASRVLKELFLTKGTVLGETARSLYRFEDAIFKAMVFARKRDEGFSDGQIIAYLRNSYVDYTKPLPPVVRNLDRGGVFPFASFTVRSAPVAFRAMAENPVKFALYGTALYASSLIPDEKENELLPVWAKGSGNIFFVPKFLVWDSEDGKTIEGLNVGRWAIGMRSNPLEIINAWTNPLAEDGLWEQKLGYMGALIKIFTSQNPNDKKGFTDRAVAGYKEIAPNYAGKLVGDLMAADGEKIDKLSHKAITKGEVIKDYLLGKDLSIHKAAATKELWESKERKFKDSMRKVAYGEMNFESLMLEAKRVQKVGEAFEKKITINEEKLKAAVLNKITDYARKVKEDNDLSPDEKKAKMAKLRKSYENLKK